MAFGPPGPERPAARDDRSAFISTWNYSGRNGPPRATIGARSYRLGIIRAGTARIILESRVLLVEEQVHRSDRPVALLPNDHFGLSFERVPFLVHRTVIELLTVQE